MSFPPYPSYRHSGVEWLGEVPTHWSVHRISELYREAAEPGHDELPILSVSIHDGVSDDEVESDDEGRKVNRSDDRSKYKKVKPNDLVYNMMRAWQGGFGSVKVLGMVSPAYVVARPRNFVPSGLIELILRTAGAIEEMRRRSKGVTDFRLRLYWDEFKDMRIALPPAREQLDIIDFISHETAKIDVLVEEQRRLIALLREKRQAVISHAVTKGLNPTAPMRDSGIEWLGEVPAHWKILPLRRLVDQNRRITYGIVQPGEPDPNGRLMVRGQDYSRGWSKLDDVFRVSNTIEEPYKRARLTAGDIVVTIVGAGTGNAAIVPPNFAGSNITQTTARVAPASDQITSEYMALLIGSRIGSIQVALYQKGAAQPGLNLEHLNAFRFPLPSLEEQHEIVAKTLPKLNKISALLMAAEMAIALLDERRAALISAAITGKIDVRGLTKMLPFPVTRAHARALIAVGIIEHSAHQATFGRVKLQKIAYLAEAHIGIAELEGAYLRESAGPLDREMIREMEHEAGSLAGIRVEQPFGTGSAVTYKLGDRRGAHRQDLAALLGDRTGEFDKLIEDIGTIDTKGAEAVATLYAVWNDALIDGETPPDMEIKLAVLTEWHPEKAKKFRLDELQIWLDWMRRHDLIPTGTGPKTSTGRLFA